MTTADFTPENFAALQDEIMRLKSDLADKTTIIEALLRRLYRPKTDAFDPGQLGLFDPIKDADVATPNAASAPASTRESADKKPGHGRTTFPDRLPRETQETDLPENERACSVCGTEMKSIGINTCERGDIRPVTIIVKRWVSHKYACPNGHEVKSSEGAPSGLVERAKWTTESYAFVVVSKFQDHQPLERIEKSLKRHGVDVPASTLGSMNEVAAEKLALVLGQAKREILADDHIEADATGIKTFREVPGKDADKKPTKELRNGTLWVWKAGEKLLMNFHWSSGSEEPSTFLKGWTGTILADGAQIYDAAVIAERLRRAGCWAHVRRKFVEAFDLKWIAAGWILLLIRRLYRIESAIKKRLAAKRSTDPSSDDDLRRRVRRELSAKIVAKINLEVCRLRADVRPTPKSPLGKALTYIENQWTRLLVFLDDPKVPIDNNAVERAIRPVAVGRRNYGFAGSERGAKNAAVLYSIINTCIALKINAYDYLVDVLERISPNADLKSLTPWAWAARQHAAATVTAAPIDATTPDIF